MKKYYYTALFIAIASAFMAAALFSFYSGQWFMATAVCFLFFLFFLEWPKAALLLFISCSTTAMYFGMESGGSAGVVGVSGMLNLSMLLAGLVFMAYKKTDLRGMQIAAPAALLVFFAVIPAVFSGHRIYAFRHALRLCEALVLYILVFEVFRSRKEFTAMLTAIVLSLAVPCTLAVWQWVHKTGIWDGRYHRVQSTFTDPNHFAYYIVVCMSAIFVLWLFKKSAAGKLFAWVMACFCLPALYFSFSRMAWAAMVLVSVVFFMLRPNRPTVLFLIFFFGILFFTPDFTARLANLFNLREGQLPASDFFWRIHHWRSMLPLIIKAPFFGCGLGVSLARTSEMYGLEIFPHNDYLKVAVEIGIVGLISYVWMLFIFFRSGIRVYRQAKDSFLKVFSASFIALMASWFAVSMFIDMALTEISFQFIMVLAALSASAESLLVKEANHADIAGDMH